MERFILKKLLDWKDSPYRKPLILKGVRQVGKTWILKEFGRRCYENTAQQELNSTQILHIAWLFSLFKPAMKNLPEQKSESFSATLAPRILRITQLRCIQTAATAMPEAIYGLPLHSIRFQKIKYFVFLKVTSCIYYSQTV